jgi:hypothetical protein
MTMLPSETPLSIHLERLRAVLEKLAFVRDGARHEELLDQARMAISNVRAARAAVAAKGGKKGRPSITPGTVLDYAGYRTRSGQPPTSNSN